MKTKNTQFFPGGRRVITLRLIREVGEEQIGLFFPVESNLKELVEELPGIKWSQQHSCYYMTRSPKQIASLMLHIKGRGIWVDQRALPDHKNKATGGPALQSEQLEDVQAGRKGHSRPLPVEVQEKIEQFRAYMQQKRYSNATIKTYGSMVCQFFAWHADRDPEAITHSDIVDFNYEFHIKKEHSYATQNQFVSALKLFYKFYEMPGIVPERIERPRRQRKLPNVLTKEEVKRLLMSTTNIKHKCLLSLVYGGGLRIGEALRMRISDVRSAEKLLYVRKGKGSKDRRVPLSETMLRILREYYMAYRPEEYLFEGQKGGRYSASSARKVLKRAAERAGIRVPITLHTLRHSYATHLLESGVGLRYIQEILGHNSPRTTMLYTHVSGKRLSEVRSPLEDLDL